MINFLFTADIHANKTRLDKVIQFFEKCKKIITDKKINYFVIGGDLWNAMISNSKASGFVDILNELNDISKMCKVVAIYGTSSHEISGSLDCLIPLGVEVYDKNTLIEKDGIKILYIPEPRRSNYIRPTAQETTDAMIKDLNKAFDNKADLVFFHGEISGAVLQNGTTSKSDVQVTHEMFKRCGAKLMLAGHIHNPQDVFTGAHYVGSPIPCTYGEGHDGSVYTFSFSDGKVINLERNYLNFPINKMMDIDSLELFEKLHSFNFKNNNVKIKLKLTPDEKLKFNIREEAKKLKELTGANEIIINVSAKSEVSIRSTEIHKANTIQEKLEIYAKINQIELSDDTINKVKELEDNLLTQYLSPTHSFELVSLSLRGAKGIKSKEEININFNDYNSGVIALIGDNGSGKCVKGSTLVLSDKGFERIDSYDDGNRGYREMSKMFTIDKNFKDTSSHYYSEDVEKTIEITNSLGMTLEGTYDHPVLTLNKNLSYEFKRLKDITTDDYVCVPRGMNSFPETSPELFYVPHDITPIQLSALKPVKFPTTVTVEFAKFLGYYVANGNRDIKGIVFTTKSKRIADDFINCVKESFGIEIKYNENRSKCVVNSDLIKQFIEYVFNDRLDTARYKKIPDCILQSTKQVQKAFLTALFDCDSSISRNVFEYCTASEDIAHKVQNMLLNFGVISIHKLKRVKGYDWNYHRIFVYSNDLNILMSDVMDNSLKYSYSHNDRINTNIDTIPFVKQFIEKNYHSKSNCGHISLAKSKCTTKNTLKKYIEKLDMRNNIREKLETIYNDNYFFSKVVKVEKHNDKMTVYDFTIPKSHMFYSNGFISHNTTILENCSPFPRLITRSGALRSHFYLKDSHRIVVYKDENGTFYRFTIQIAAHIESGIVKYFAETSEDGENWTSVPGVDGNLDSYSEYVKGLFGSVEIYLRTAFFTKGKVKGVNDIATATKSERIQLLSDLLGLDSLTELHDMVKDKLKDIKKEIDSLDNIEEKYAEVQCEIDKKNINKKNYKSELNETESKLEEIESSIKNTKIAKENFNKNYAKFDNAIEMKTNCENEIAEITEHLDKLKEHKTRNDFCKNHTKQIDEYKTKLEEYKPLKEKLDKLSKEYHKHSEDFIEVSNSFNSIQSKKEIEENKLNSVDGRIKSAEESLIQVDDFCPTCGAKLSASKKKDLIKAQSYQVAEIESLKEFKETQKKIVSDIKKQYTDIKKKFEKAKLNKENYKKEYDELDEKVTSFEVYLDMNEQYKEFIDYVIVGNLEEDIERFQKSLDSNLEMLKTFEGLEFVDYDAELEKLESERKEHESYRLKYSVDIASLNTEIKQLEDKLQSMKDDADKMDQLSKDFKEYSILEEAFSNSGIQALELESVVPEIALLTNQILNESYGDKFSVTFTTLKESRNKIIDDFSIDVTNHETGWTIPIEILSEGEKVWIIQALYFAFSITRMQRTGFNYAVRFADESDGALDSDARGKYINMISSAHKAGNSRLTIIVTHSQEVKDIIDQNIQL